MKESDRPVRGVPISHTDNSHTGTRSGPATEQPASADPLPIELSPRTSKEAIPEKRDLRAAARYPFSSSAEVFEPQTGTRISGRVSDLGVGGCYIDTVSTFPMGTAVRLRLTNEGSALHAAAIVTYSAPGMGMGLAFTRMTPEHANLLSVWLTSLSGDASSEPDWEEETQTQQQAPTLADPDTHLPDLVKVNEAALELVELLMYKRILTEAEALRLREKLSR